MAKNTTKLLEVGTNIVNTAIEQEAQIGALTKDLISLVDTPANPEGTEHNTQVECIFLTSYYVYEKNIAEMLLSLAKYQLPWDQVQADIAIHWVEEKLYCYNLW